MAQETHITPADFFWNAAAQEAGFSGQFWLDAYNRYLDAVQRDPSQSFDKWEVERTFRVPFESGHVDVLVRMQPDGREYCALRFTVFPAGDGPDPFASWTVGILLWRRRERNASHTGRRCLAGLYEPLVTEPAPKPATPAGTAINPTVRR